MDRLIYQGLQERSLEKTIINEAGRFRPDIRPSSTNEQLAVERENLQEVEQLLKSVDKVFERLCFTAFAVGSSYCRHGSIGSDQVCFT